MAILKGNRNQGGYIELGTETRIQISQYPTLWNQKALYLVSSPQTTDVAVRDGVAQIVSTRSTAFGSSWDGNGDLGLKVNVYNSAANTVSYGGLRGLHVYVRQYSGGNIANMYGALIDTDDRGTSSGGSVATIQSLTVAQRINSVVATMANILVVEDNSQGTITPTTCTGTALIKIRSTQPIASGARASAIHFETSGSGSGWTNAFSFQTATGLEGFTALTNASVAGNIDGYIKVYDVANGATLYIALYDTVPS
ncbi:MAG: hypothetical protein WC455_17970 [Dehalococcoidia bacterium]|jgi:hypothetical protein